MPKIENVHITGLTEKGKNDKNLAEAFKVMLSAVSKPTNTSKVTPTDAHDSQLFSKK